MGCGKTQEPLTIDVNPTRPVVSRLAKKAAPQPQEIEEPIVEVAEPITFRVTAYCSCEKCCGEWAKNRPRDEYGNEIVYGASGEVLVSGVSCAGTLPFGTKVDLEGFGTVVVQDRFAQWIVDKHGENIIDIYFNDHQAALEVGEQYLEGVVLE